jgi:hypothetical protein
MALRVKRAPRPLPLNHSEGSISAAKIVTRSTAIPASIALSGRRRLLQPAPTENQLTRLPIPSFHCGRSGRAVHAIEKAMIPRRVSCGTKCATDWRAGRVVRSLECQPIARGSSSSWLALSPVPWIDARKTAFDNPHSDRQTGQRRGEASRTIETWNVGHRVRRTLGIDDAFEAAWGGLSLESPNSLKLPPISLKESPVRNASCS